MRQIRFHYQSPCTLRHRNKIKSFLMEKCAIKHIPAFDIKYIFVSDDFLLDINRNHLAHDFFTDIITFDLSEQPGMLTAEIYISVDRVRENAKQFKVKFHHELLRVMFHGMLHLFGFDDSTPAQRSTMSDMENQWLFEYPNKLT